MSIERRVIERKVRELVAAALTAPQFDTVSSPGAEQAHTKQAPPRQAGALPASAPQASAPQPAAPRAGTPGPGVAHPNPSANSPGAAGQRAASTQPPAQWPAGIVTEREVEDLVRRGAPLQPPTGTRLTPLAQETLDRLRMGRASLAPSMSKRREPSHAPAAGPSPEAARKPRGDAVALGADHGGFALKEHLKAHLAARGFEIIDCGTHDTQACDYPVFARAVAAQVTRGAAAAGIMVDGAGLGSAMAINKLPGVRAAPCHDPVAAQNAREHNHAHVLTLGAGFIGPALAAATADAFLATPFGEGRHARRVALIEAGAQSQEGGSR